jgi:hypothetical protein
VGERRRAACHAIAAHHASQLTMKHMTILLAGSGRNLQCNKQAQNTDMLYNGRTYSSAVYYAFTAADVCCRAAIGAGGTRGYGGGGTGAW